MDLLIYWQMNLSEARKTVSYTHLDVYKRQTLYCKCKEKHRDRKERTSVTNISSQTFDEERALYGSRDLVISNCTFDGPNDGESALKESSRITVQNSFFNLRYPFWHDHELKITGCELTDLCRAALWYSSDITISDTKLHGIKALRECSDVSIRGSSILSPEFGW